MASLQIGKDERFCTSHYPRITIHHIQVGADIRRQIRFVDHQQVGTRRATASMTADDPTFARSPAVREAQAR